MIKRIIPWTVQPPIGVGVNKKWIDRGLVALFDCRQARELISGDFATNRTSLVAPSTRGMAADFSSTANQHYAHRPAYVITGAITIVVFCEIDTLTNYGALISKAGAAVANIPYELRVGLAATDSKIDFVRAGANVTQQSYSADLLSAGFKGLIAVSSPSGIITDTPTATINGVITSLSTKTGAGIGNCTDNGSSAVWIGRRFDGATQLDGRIYYVPLFNVALSAAYLKELYENPWDVYAPQQRNIWVDVSGGTSVSVNVIGLTGTTALGTVSVTAIQNASTSVTGLLGTSALGTVSVTAIQNASTSVTGLTGTSALGIVTVDVGGSTSVSVTGLLGTSALGTVSVTAVRNVSTSVTGLLGTSALGSVTVTTGSGADVSVNVTGLSGTASLGTVLVWGLVDTTQTPNWLAINTTQTPNWTRIAT